MIVNLELCFDFREKEEFILKFTEGPLYITLMQKYNIIEVLEVSMKFNQLFSI